MPSTGEDLIRKQFLLYPSQVKKMTLLARQQNASVAEMVRKAITVFDPESSGDMKESELLELVSARVKEAFEQTRETRIRLDKTLAVLQAGEK